MNFTRPFRHFISQRCLYKCSNKISYVPKPRDPVHSIAGLTTSMRDPTPKVSLDYAENYGQPTHMTHPHLVGENEVVQGITLDEMQDRRLRLMKTIRRYSLGVHPKISTHMVIVPSATTQYMSDKIPYVFRQNTDFRYLSGCLEPDSVLVLLIDQKDNLRSVLFMRGKDKNAELWNGPRTGVENAVDYFGVDEAYPVEYFYPFLKGVKENRPQHTGIWYNKKTSCQPKVTDAVNSVSKDDGFSLIDSPNAFIQKLRLIKSPAEIALMRQSCRIASESINETIKETRVGDSEHHIFAKVDYKCRMKNASYLAYPPVVASGRNGNIIHYINNTQVTKDGDLVLLDAGCEYAGYTSDITRTWPVNGRFSDSQSILYEILQLLQNELLRTLLNVGGKTLDELFDTMCLRLGKYLQEVGLISKSVSGTELAKAAYSFCPHHVSHYLGMDVHDTPLMSRSIKLVPGMVCTVEPGIYIGADRTDVSEEFRGLGLRIEDDVLISSEESIEVLTEICQKEKQSIEILAQ